jgi:hypothetical protein
MATLVRCIEGHAFDMTASETCPICGSTVWKKSTASKREPIDENKPPRDRTKAKELAVVTISIVFSLAMIFAIAFGVGQLMPAGGIKLVIHDAWERIHPPPRRTDEEKRNSFTKRLGAESKADDKNKVSQPATPKEIPNPFVSPKSENPFDPKIRFDSK